MKYRVSAIITILILIFISNVFALPEVRKFTLDDFNILCNPYSLLKAGKVNLTFVNTKIQTKDFVNTKIQTNKINLIIENQNYQLH